MFFGWKPSPANWGVIATLLLQYVASYRPDREGRGGPESFAPYQYVDGGAFVEPWLGIRPWLAVALWGWGPISCFGKPALHHKKKEAEGHRITHNLRSGESMWTPCRERSPSRTTKSTAQKSSLRALSSTHGTPGYPETPPGVKGEDGTMGAM